MANSKIITITIILIIIVFAIFQLTKSKPDTNEEVTKCIGENSVLYTQIGCHACEKQEEIFGENYKHLNVVDCFFERDACEGILKTPTWVIGEKKYEGTHSIETLKQLTGC